MRITKGDFNDPQLIWLLKHHLKEMQTHSPEGSVFALDIIELQNDNIEFWCGWENSELVACGAIKFHSIGQSEIKSMRTHPNALSKGYGTKILAHLIQRARDSDCHRLSLETGSGNLFKPAIALYEKAGFVSGSAFGSYKQSDFNQFFHLTLS